MSEQAVKMSGSDKEQFLVWWYENSMRAHGIDPVVERIVRQQLKDAYERETGNTIPSEYIDA